MSSSSNPESRTYVLVTGANSGLGLATCERLIDEFVAKKPGNQGLTVIFTTRDPKKSQATLRRLQGVIEKWSVAAGRSLSSQIQLQPETLDLLSIKSVYTLAEKLNSSIPYLNTIICNAGICGTISIDWVKATIQLTLNMVEGATYPRYKRAVIGELSPPQESYSRNGGSVNTQPPLGSVFNSNVFGHYILVHQAMPLFQKAPDHGRVVWISSIEAYSSTLDMKDFQGLESNVTYESSKRITDLLALTSDLPGPAPFVKNFLEGPQGLQSTRKSGDRNEETVSQPPLFVLAHPGICLTSIVPTSIFLVYVHYIMCMICRMFGTRWHNIRPYNGAAAPVWCTLIDRDELEDRERKEGKAKWGSSCDWQGRGSVIKTAVYDWGIGGKVGEELVVNIHGPEKIEDVTRERRERFEETGRAVWKEMESLRVYWDTWLRKPKDS